MIKLPKVAHTCTPFGLKMNRSFKKTYAAYAHYIALTVFKRYQKQKRNKLNPLNVKSHEYLNARMFILNIVFVFVGIECLKTLNLQRD